MDYLSTRQVARLLGVSVSLLTKAVWCGRVDPPQKSPSGNYLWTPADIERVARALFGERGAGRKQYGCGKMTRSGAGKRAAARTRHATIEQSQRRNTNPKRAWLIFGGLRNWLWRLFDRVIKAFFDALFEHLRKV